MSAADWPKSPCNGQLAETSGDVGSSKPADWSANRLSSIRRMDAFPPLRPEAIQRLIGRENSRAGRGEGDSWLDRNSWERCISRTLPIAMIPNVYNANYQIFQTPDHVAIVMEMIHETRIIPLDGRPHVADGIRQWLGDSRGRWEDDTLVVETTGFHNRLDGGDYQPSHIIQTTHRGPGGDLTARRALPTGRHEPDRLSVHRRGSEDLHASVHGGHSDDSA